MAQLKQNIAGFFSTLRLKLSYRIAARISDTTVPPVAGASTQS